MAPLYVDLASEPIIPIAPLRLPHLSQWNCGPFVRLCLRNDPLLRDANIILILQYASQTTANRNRQSTTCQAKGTGSSTGRPSIESCTTPTACQAKGTGSSTGYPSIESCT